MPKYFARLIKLMITAKTPNSNKFLKRNKKAPLTRTLKPETEAKEDAIEALDKASSPRWPTNIIDITCKQYCSKLTAIRGPASHSCFVASSITFALLQILCRWDVSPSNSWPLSLPRIRGDWRLDFWSPLSIIAAWFYRSFSIDHFYHIKE